MIIVLEGCDGSGKTTLAKKLAKIFHARIEHQSKPCSFEEYEKQIETKDNIIFDRFCLGQFVYNTFEERKMTLMDLEYLKRDLKLRNVVLIYLDQPENILLERLQNRSKEEKEIDRKMMKKLHCHSFKEYVRLIKKRYESVIDGFIILKGEDINE